MLRRLFGHFPFHNPNNSTSSLGLLGWRCINLQMCCTFDVIGWLIANLFQIWLTVAGYSGVSQYEIEKYFEWIISHFLALSNKVHNPPRVSVYDNEPNKSVNLSLRSKRFRAVLEQRTRNESQRPRERWRKWKSAAKTKNPVPRSFFAPKPNGNACYAGYVNLARKDCII